MSTWAVSLFPSLFDETGTDGLARYQAIDSIGLVIVISLVFDVIRGYTILVE